MAGHSHWAGIKHKKGKADKQRSKLFSKLSREITVAAKLGMPDPDMNPRLRSAVQAAKEANMPKDNIDRAIKKSQGNDEANYEAVVYEGFGPSGTAMIVEALTDNKNRTISNMRSIFEKNGCSLGTEGSVSYQFEICGLIKIKKDSCSEDEIFEQSTNFGQRILKLKANFMKFIQKKIIYTKFKANLKKSINLIFVELFIIQRAQLKLKNKTLKKLSIL
jgi:YebC/PmpR family DNA-binding regulatory protein